MRLKIAALDDESSDLLSARERAALRFAEKLAVAHHKVDDTLWAEVREHLSEAEARPRTPMRCCRRWTAALS